MPRFLPRFPSHTEQALRLLLALYSDGAPAPAPPATNPGNTLRGGNAASLPNGVFKPGPGASPSPPPQGAAAVDGDGGRAAAGGREATSGLDGSDLAAAMRRDALLGLGNVLETAVRQQQQAGGAGGAPAGAVAAERTVPVVTELVQFVLR